MASGVVAVGHDVLDPPAEVVLRLAVQDRDVVAGLQQFLHQRAADEQSSADYQNFHRLPDIRRGGGTVRVTGVSDCD